MLSYPDFRYKQIAVHMVGGEGERVKFSADNLVIKDKDDNVLFQHSCHRLFALFIVGEVSLTSYLIRKAIAHAFPIVLLNRNLHMYARINCVAEGNTLLRQKQYTTTRALEIARQLIEQKVDNQRSLLQHLRSPSQDDRRAVQSLRDKTALNEAQSIHEIMGFEGQASRTFFAAYFRPLHWRRREPRCKRDIYNLLLDIGYAYLFNFIDSLLSLYGFDTYSGVLHTYFFHRKSLVCDLVEPFRCIIDRRLRKAYNLNQIKEEDFFFKDQQWHLVYKEQAKYTRLFLKDILAEKEALFKYCQAYYRWFIRDAPIGDFPVYHIHEEV